MNKKSVFIILMFLLSIFNLPVVKASLDCPVLKGIGTRYATTTTQCRPYYPVTVDDGDFVIAILGQSGTSTTFSTPAGWTKLRTDTATNLQQTVYYRTCDGTEDDAQVLFTATGTAQKFGVMYSFTGVNTTSPIMYEGADTSNGGTTIVNDNDVETTGIYNLALNFLLIRYTITFLDFEEESGGSWIIEDDEDLVGTPRLEHGLYSCNATNEGTIGGGSWNWSDQTPNTYAWVNTGIALRGLITAQMYVNTATNGNGGGYIYKWAMDASTEPYNPDVVIWIIALAWDNSTFKGFTNATYNTNPYNVTMDATMFQIDYLFNATFLLREPSSLLITGNATITLDNETITTPDTVYFEENKTYSLNAISGYQESSNYTSDGVYLTITGNAIIEVDDVIISQPIKRHFEDNTNHTLSALNDSEVIEDIDNINYLMFGFTFIILLGFFILWLVNVRGS